MKILTVSIKYLVSERKAFGLKTWEYKTLGSWSSWDFFLFFTLNYWGYEASEIWILRTLTSEHSTQYYYGILKTFGSRLSVLWVLDSGFWMLDAIFCLLCSFGSVDPRKSVLWTFNTGIWALHYWPWTSGSGIWYSNFYSGLWTFGFSTWFCTLETLDCTSAPEL